MQGSVTWFYARNTLGTPCTSVIPESVFQVRPSSRFLQRVECGYQVTLRPCLCMPPPSPTCSNTPHNALEDLLEFWKYTQVHVSVSYHYCFAWALQQKFVASASTRPRRQTRDDWRRKSPQHARHPVRPRTSYRTTTITTTTHL